MDRDPTQKQYFTSQSTIVSSQFPASKQLPTFNHNYNEIYDTNKYQGGYYNPQQYSASINSFNIQSPQEEINYGKYTNQYYDDSGEGQANLSRSAIIDNSYSTNVTKLSELLTPTEKKCNLNKYTNMSMSKLQEYKLQEQPEDFGYGKEDMGNQQGQKQGVSFQFSPKKMKKVQEQGFTKQLSGTQKQDSEKNNLSNYKRVELFNPNRDKRSISGQVGNIQFNLHPQSASHIESPNNSGETKLLKRQFSSGAKDTVKKFQSPLSSNESNHFSNQNKKQMNFISNSVLQKSYSINNNSRNFVKQDFVVVRKLGKGKYGDVSLTINRQVGMLCALKSISKSTILQDQGGINQFIRQVTIQMFLCHQHIIQCWGLFCDVENVYLIMQPALDGQLYKYMKHKKQLCQQETASLIKQLCLGVEYLQSQKIIHRDLKPQNILLHEGKLKIGDFGWAVYNQDSFRETFCGTPLYLSPDVLKGDQYNDKVDNWAIGIITYQMLVGRIPFKITQQSQMQKIITQQIQFPNYLSLSDSAKDFVLALLDRDPDTRLDIEAILNHRFLNE